MEILLINTTIDRAYNVDTSQVLKYTVCNIPLVVTYKTLHQDLFNTGKTTEQVMTGGMYIDICLN